MMTSEEKRIMEINKLVKGKAKLVKMEGKTKKQGKKSKIRSGILDKKEGDFLTFVKREIICIMPLKKERAKEIWEEVMPFIKRPEGVYNIKEKKVERVLEEEIYSKLNNEFIGLLAFRYGIHRKIFQVLEEVKGGGGEEIEVIIFKEKNGKIKVKGKVKAGDIGEGLGRMKQGPLAIKWRSKRGIYLTTVRGEGRGERMGNLLYNRTYSESHKINGEDLLILDL